MGSLTKDTFQILKLYQKKGFVFALFYRLVTTPLYLLALNKGLQFTLNKADYSYLTTANIGFYLIKPVTILWILGMLLFGILILLLETGCFLTLYQGTFYSRKLSFGEILTGGLIKLWDEIREKNWRLGLLVLAHYVWMNLYFIYRMFVHLKPLNFVMNEIFKQPWGSASLIVPMILLFLLAFPGLYTVHVCMVEQRNYRDGYFRSWWLLKDRLLEVLAIIAGYYVLVIAAFWGIYAIGVFLTAVIVTLFTDSSLTLALMSAAVDRMELVLLFLTSIFMVSGITGAISVQYFRFSSKISRKTAVIRLGNTKTNSRKMTLVLISVIIVLSLLSFFDVVRNGSLITGELLSEIQITAHRGSLREAPENTMAAITKAVEDLADYVEIDVQETSDKIVVLGHDNTLKRVAGVNRPIRSYTFKELETVDVGAWFSDEYKGERIPSLMEVMEYCKGKIRINIEIKGQKPGSDLPEQVVFLIQEYQMEEQCVVTSTRLSYLARIKKLDPKIRTGYILSAAYGNCYSSDDIDFISLRSNFVSERLVESAHEKGKAVHAWTINTKGEMERMKMLKVDNIITDYPVLTREIIYRKEAEENLLEYVRLLLK
ncbi:glycerophosphodiester phosphodiesterase family protein [Clostridium sp. E02]|uniref:glycerophosphodiester phosphodiesterase family protein n=1 Tax=Clostridium sp. E02 TaxID=2487134 RepID=UPI000F5485D9|nr:glycerophosphodiester phosphodiesterase family protein [Clostridium sp. E02]